MSKQENRRNWTEMTKRVRIENADTERSRVSIEIWEKNGQEIGIDKMVDQIFLDNPADMSDERVYVTSNRYLVVREVR